MTREGKKKERVRLPLRGLPMRNRFCCADSCRFVQKRDKGVTWRSYLCKENGRSTQSYPGGIGERNPHLPNSLLTP